MRSRVSRLIERAGLIALLAVTGCATILGIDQGSPAGDGSLDASVADVSNDQSGDDQLASGPDGSAGNDATLGDDSAQGADVVPGIDAPADAPPDSFDGNCYSPTSCPTNPAATASASGSASSSSCGECGMPGAFTCPNGGLAWSCSGAFMPPQGATNGCCVDVDSGQPALTLAYCCTP